MIIHYKRIIQFNAIPNIECHESENHDLIIKTVAPLVATSENSILAALLASDVTNGNADNALV